MVKRSRKPKAWQDFEQEVALLYQELGAREVEVDKDVAGNQVDVFAIVPRIDGTYSRDIISCKCYSRNAGVKDVREWHEVFQACFRANEADNAVLVTNNEFSRQAKVLARSTGIHLRTVEQLKWANVDLGPYVQEASAEMQAEPVFRDGIYVPLRFIREGEQRELPEAVLLDAFLSRSSCPLLTILGDYGSGKTTLSKHIFLEQSRRFLANNDDARIPVYMDLRDYPGHLNVPGFILDVLINQHNARCPNYAKVNRLIGAGHVLLIFDAFDEMIARGDYDETLRNFQAVLRVLNGKSKAILTCRTHYFKSPHEIHDAHKGTELFQVSRSNKYEIAYIQPLSEEEIEAIVASSCGDSANAVMERVRCTYDLMGLARRPILLQMITAVIDDLIASSEPINNAKLYDHYVNQWLLRDDWRVKLDRRTRRSFTIVFATEMYIQDKLQFTLEELDSAIRRHFAGASQSLLDDYSNDIRVCSFIRLNGNVFEFAHRSFVEYFIALQLYSDIAEDNNERLSTVRFTQEVISFLSQQFPTKEVRGNIRRWLKDTESNEVLGANVLGVLTGWEHKLTGKIKRLRLIGDTPNDVDMIECNLSEMIALEHTWQDVKWRCVTSDGGNWSTCKWRNAMFEEVLFLEDSFHSTEFTELECHDARWQRCTLHESEFSLAGNGKIVFRDCTLKDCCFTLPPGAIVATKCEFNGCQFNAIGQLSNCSVMDSKFENVDLSSALLMESTFIRGSFAGAVLSAECLEGARFERVDLGNADIRLKGARRWQKPPQFVATTGLSEETVGRMKKMGARFEDKLPSSVGE